MQSQWKSMTNENVIKMEERIKHKKHSKNAKGGIDIKQENPQAKMQPKGRDGKVRRMEKNTLFEKYTTLKILFGEYTRDG